MAESMGSQAISAMVRLAGAIETNREWTTGKYSREAMLIAAALTIAADRVGVALERAAGVR